MILFAICCSKISSQILFQEFILTVVGELSRNRVFQLRDVTLYADDAERTFPSEDDLILDEVSHSESPFSESRQAEGRPGRAS
ncbi:hypothetical protein X962_4101 [Burkholderia pseudomallei MSHR7343]|nr:hypothetical protein X962_4101 [Burkholderia pseudomallei MSHR7343]